MNLMSYILDIVITIDSEIYGSEMKELIKASGEASTEKSDLHIPQNLCEASA